MAQTKTNLSDDEKKAWVHFCETAGNSEAVMLRRIILKVVTGVVPDEFSSRGEPETGKVTVRLTENERVKLLERARREGYSNATSWTTASVRAALHKEPVLTDREVAALRESNRELAAISRNLNQVARALNVQFRNSDKINREAIEKLSEHIGNHKDQVASLLYRNMSRWSDDG